MIRSVWELIKKRIEIGEEEVEWWKKRREKEERERGTV